MTKHLFALFTLVLLPLGLAAQDTAYIELKPTKKIIHISKMDIPSNTNIKDILEMMPELLTRASDFLWQNYSIQLDGKDVSDSRDVILTQTRVSQVKDLEISDSPSASEQKKGQGGIINIVPLTPDSGFHGRALLDASTLWDVMPSAMFTYQHGDWWLNSGIMMEYFNGRNTSHVQQYTPTSHTMHNDSIHDVFGQETAFLMVKLKNSHHDFKFNFRETYSSRRQDFQMPTVIDQPLTSYVYERHTGTDARQGLGSKLDMFVNADYKYIFDNKNELRIELDYRLAPTFDSTFTFYDPQLRFILGDMSRRWTNEYTQPHTASAKLETKLYAYNHAKTDMLFFKLGLDGTYSYSKLYGLDACERSSILDPVIDIQASAINQFAYVSPYLQTEWAKDIWYLQVDLRHQWRRDIIQIIGSPTDDMAKHDWTGKISLNCEVAPKHHLRLLLDRGLLRPSATQLYSIMRYNPVDNSYIQGNRDLHAASTNTANLTYLFSSQVGEHYFNTTLAGIYTYADGLIQSTRVFDPKQQYSYLTYVNSGKSHILNLNLNFIYHYRAFTLSFAANGYDRIVPGQAKASHYYFYNLALAPIFRFKYDWTLAGKALYNSAIRQDNYTQGDCFYMQLSLSKKYKDWNFFAKLNDVFDYTNTDTKVQGDEITYTYYDLYKRSFSLGFEYTF